MFSDLNGTTGGVIAEYLATSFTCVGRLKERGITQ